MSPLTPDEVQILYDEDDITDFVMYRTARFTSMMAAAPGSWEFVCRDPNRELEFITGHEITVKLNGVEVYGGPVWVVDKDYAFPADDTSNMDDVHSRLWGLSGTDWNIIFDKRVLRNPAHYVPDATHGANIFSPGTSSYSIQVVAPVKDGEVVRGGPARDGLLFGGIHRFFDLSGFETEDPDFIKDNWTFPKGYTYPQQGEKLRAVMDDIARASTRPDVTAISVYYMRGKQLNFVSILETAQEWGFSDVPDGTTYFGFRLGRGSTNGASIVNDGLVWGGSEWNAAGDVVFARVQDSASQALHGRWQASDVAVGSPGYLLQDSVDQKANQMIFGSEDGFDTNSMGLTNPEQTFSGTWFNTRVPAVLYPGQVVPVRLSVFGDDPIELALRSLEMSWPGAVDVGEERSKGWTMFKGEFGMLMSDPAWMWKYLQKLRPGKIVHQVVATATNITSRPVYGALYMDQPATQAVSGDDIVVTLDPPNGSKTVFHIPFRYIHNTSKLFLDGILQLRGIDYEETSPAAGTYTVFVAPDSDVVMQIHTVVAGTLET